MRSLFAFLILGFGLWTLYDTAMMIGFDPDMPEEAIQLVKGDLELAFRVAGSVLAILGGLLSFIRGTLGPGIALLGAISFALIVISLSVQGIEIEYWKQAAINGLILLGLSFGRGLFGRV